MGRVLVLALAVCACGGEPNRTAAPEPTPTPDASAEEAELASVLKNEGVSACARACARLVACAESETNECHQDCVDVLAREQAAPAVRYAACVDGLSCEAIRKSMSMGMGPVGVCYVEAQRMAR